MSDAQNEPRKLKLDVDELEVDSLDVEELEQVAGGAEIDNCPNYAASCGGGCNAVASCGGSCGISCGGACITTGATCDVC